MILILIILILIINQVNKQKYENYSNYNNIKCPLNIKKLSNFCIWDKDSESCKCVFQKSNDYYYNFPICCKKDCSKLSKKECVPNKNVEYYCQNNAGTDCYKYNTFIDNEKISGNVCGIDILTNNYKKPYMSYNECKNDLNECIKYKDLDKCVENHKCGWCSDNKGKGKCIEGTAEGPIDIFKYNYCDPNQKNTNNSWTYGKVINY